MKSIKTLALAVIALPAIGLAATAPPVDKVQAESCGNIKWSAAFLNEYPKAPAACRSVVVSDGTKFATFDGKVSKVGADFVQVEISDVAGLPISSIAFQIGVGGKVMLNDKAVAVKTLQVGDELTFWVREGQFGISPTLNDKPMRILKPEAVPAAS
jgi:hypothetical protein